jgi:hypothetical protein
MAILTRGSAALVLDSTGTTILGALMALQDIDLDALLASNPRLADLAGQVVQFTPTYWLDWIARNPGSTGGLFSQRASPRKPATGG